MIIYSSFIVFCNIVFYFYVFLNSRYIDPHSPPPIFIYYYPQCNVNLYRYTNTVVSLSNFKKITFIILCYFFSLVLHYMFIIISFLIFGHLVSYSYYVIQDLHRRIHNSLYINSEKGIWFIDLENSDIRVHVLEYEYCTLYDDHG